MERAIPETRVILTVLAGFVVAFASFAFPSNTSAEALSVQTAQLMPPGASSSCGTLKVSGFTPYIYDGSIDAFEFSVDDSSYVAIAGSAGKTDIPFNQMTRRIEASGSLRVHADISSTPVGSGVVVRVTLLSAKQGSQTVCISILTTMVSPEGVLTPAPATPTPAPTGGTVTPKPKPAPAPMPKPSPAPKPLPTTTGATSVAPVATAQNILKDMCAAGGAARLWLILLVLYAIVVTIAVFGQPQLPSALRSQEWIAAVIVVPFLLLFGLWYFVESCRISAWVPAIATLIALAGLAAAFWDRSNSPTIINLPSAKA